MKKLLAICAVMLLMMTACSKEHLSKGLYYSDTKDGMLYLQLSDRNECTLFFENGEENKCTYYIKGSEIDLIGSAATKVNGRTSSWWFGGNLDAGVIDGDSFIIQTQRLCSDSIEVLYITFHKH